jgi:hypothetical protein
MPRNRRRKRKAKTPAGMVAADLHPEAARALEQLFAAFRARFGRDPREGEPIFFDPEAPGPDPVPMKPMSGELIIEALTAEGAGPEEIYAFKKTGRAGLWDAVEFWPPEWQYEWHEAVAEYLRLEADASGEKPS